MLFAASTGHRYDQSDAKFWKLDSKFSKGFGVNRASDDRKRFADLNNQVKADMLGESKRLNEQKKSLLFLTAGKT